MEASEPNDSDRRGLRAFLPLCPSNSVGQANPFTVGLGTVR